MRSIINSLFSSPKNPNLPSYYEEPEVRPEPKKIKTLPSTAKMIYWGPKSLGKRLAIVTHGKNFTDWKLCNIDEARELQFDVKPDLDKYDFAVIEDYNLNSENYQICKVDVLNGITYKVIGDRHDKSESWVKSVGKYIKLAHDNRLSEMT